MQYSNISEDLSTKLNCHIQDLTLYNKILNSLVFKSNNTNFLLVMKCQVKILT